MPASIIQMSTTHGYLCLDTKSYQTNSQSHQELAAHESKSMSIKMSARIWFWSAIWFGIDIQFTAFAECRDKKLIRFSILTSHFDTKWWFSVWWPVHWRSCIWIFTMSKFVEKGKFNRPNRQNWRDQTSWWQWQRQQKNSTKKIYINGLKVCSECTNVTLYTHNK